MRDRLATVISVRGRNQSALIADPSFVYVGRPIYRSVNWHGSVWANPFKVGISRHQAIGILGRDIDREPRATQLDGDLAVAFYRAWLKGKPELIARLAELRGKKLGCWCVDWSPGQLVTRPCHAVALAVMANAMPMEAARA